MSPYERAEIATRFGVRDEDVDFLISAARQPARSGRLPRAGLAFLLVFSAGLALAGVPSELARLATRVNPPEPGEVVPRQIPYRGYVERDGVPLPTTPSQLFSFKLEYGDGGVAWNEPSLNLPVSNGHFEVALGDSPANKIPPAVFADPFVLLSVSVGGVALNGRQRLLTAPYAQRAGNGVPLGTVVAFLGSVPEMGWLVANGQTIDAAANPDYAGLVAHLRGLGTEFQGAGVNVAVLPDLRGRFLRGLDQGANRDPDGPARALGSIQAAATQMPVVPFVTAGAGSHSHAGEVYRGTGTNLGSIFGGSGAQLSQIGAVGDHVHSIGGGDPETRPTNVAVVYLIKY